jgi:hypothetical protein
MTTKPKADKASAAETSISDFVKAIVEILDQKISAMQTRLKYGPSPPSSELEVKLAGAVRVRELILRGPAPRVDKRERHEEKEAAEKVAAA